MNKGVPNGHRHFKPVPGDPVAMDPAERTALERAGEEMLAALAREHPERVTIEHPHGTKSPRRMPSQCPDASLKTNFEP